MSEIPVVQQASSSGAGVPPASEVARPAGADCPSAEAGKMPAPLPADDGPSGIAESLADCFEAVLAAGKPWGTPPLARIPLDRDDRRLLLDAHERVLYGDLSIQAAEPHLASLARALAQVILDQEPIA